MSDAMASNVLVVRCHYLCTHPPTEENKLLDILKIVC